MTVHNPFTLAPITTAPHHASNPMASEAGDTAPAVVVTPYDALCADASRPAAFALTFVEPQAA